MKVIYKKERNSSIELMRIVLMMFIVMHHVVNSVISPGFKSHAWSCLDVILHTAVIVFVLISGYFGIRFSWKRFVSLILEVLFYTVILNIMTACIQRTSVGLKLTDLMVFSNNYYWFIAIYLQLYLVSPFLNKLLQNSSIKDLVRLLSVLSFFVFYLGFLRNDSLCADGKNLLLFVFIYVIGNLIHKKDGTILRHKKIVRIIALLMFLFVFLCYFLPDEHNLFVHAIAFMYKYNSPFLIILSILIFLIIKDFKFKSRTINWMATSSLAIYLIHEHPVFREYAYVRLFTTALNNGVYGWELLLMVFLYACILAVTCIMLDKLRVFLFSLIKI